jgi:hypothetical protein
MREEDEERKVKTLEDALEASPFDETGLYPQEYVGMEGD